MSISNIRKQAEAEGALTRSHTMSLMEAMKNDKSHKDGKLHPSSISGCPTAAAYDILGFSVGEITHSADAQRIFDLGHAIHSMLQFQYDRAGLLMRDAEGKPLVEVALAVPEWDLIGHADGLVDPKVYGKPAVLEIKSINSNAFTTLKEPKEEHKLQAACYVTALAKELDGSRLVVFIYYSKNDSKIKEFKFIVTDVQIQRVEDRVRLIHELIAKFREEGLVPAPHYDSPNKTPCRYCKYQGVCHDTLNRDQWVAAMKDLHYAPAKTQTKKPTVKKGKSKLGAPKRKPPKRE